MRIVVTMVAMGLAASVVQAQTVSPVPGAESMPLRVFDATGKLMGGTVAEPQSPSFPQLAITFRYVAGPGTPKGDTFTLRIQPELSGPKLRYRWAQPDTDVLYFESNDCSGQPYVDAFNPMPGRRLALLDYAANLLYLSAPDPTIVDLTYHSRRVPLQPCAAAGPQFILAAAINPVIDMDSVFTPTFVVR